MGLTVQLSPTLIKLYWLTEDQLENIAALNVINAVSLAFLGISAGAAVAFYTALETGDFQDPLTRIRFETYRGSAIDLSLFFGLIFLVGITLSLRKLWRIKKTKTVSPIPGKES